MNRGASFTSEKTPQTAGALYRSYSYLCFLYRKNDRFGKSFLSYHTFRCKWSILLCMGILPIASNVTSVDRYFRMGELRGDSYLRKSAVLIGVLLICYFNVNFTSALGLSCSGGHLGGGSWLFYWYLGMALKPLLDYEDKWQNIVFAISTTLLLLWEYIFVFKNCLIYFPSMFHDKQLSRGWIYVFQTVLVLLVIKSATACMENMELRIWSAASKVFLTIGKNTLYIFLYHILFRDIGWNICAGTNIWEIRVCVCALMLLGPLGLAYTKGIIQKWYVDNIGRVRIDI